MTLWVNAIYGYPARVELDLLGLVQGDTSLGDELVIIDPTVLQMTYGKTRQGFTQDRIDALVNGVFPNKIRITGVDSSYGFINNGFWQSITKIGGGVTVVKKGPLCSGATPAYTDEQIEVVYDIGGCGGIGYWVLSTSQAKIVEGPADILFHELAHAFHWANRSSLVCGSQPHAQAIGDENLMRAQFNLPKRHLVKDDGGCGPPSTYGNPWEDCFILNAVSGSPESDLVHEFERIRDSLMRPSRVGRALFAGLIAEYYQFAPHVVADMEADPELKESMKRLVVEPLLDALTLIELHVRRDLRSGDLDEEIDRVFRQGRAGLNEKGGDPDTVTRLADLIVRLKDDLASAPAKPDTAPRQFDKSSPATIFNYLASTILGSTPNTAALAWCLAQPLTIYWATASRVSVNQEPPASLREYLAEAIEEWLALAPVEWGSADDDAAASAADLQSVASCLTSRSVRHRFGASLLERHPDAQRPRLAEAMRAADFLPSAG